MLCRNETERYGAAVAGAPDSQTGPGLFDETLSVSQLARRVQAALDSSFTDDIWVEGEISNLKKSAAGHVYFRLVEPAESAAPPVAAVDVVLFDTTRRAVNAVLRRSSGVKMVDGIRVRLRGTLDFYPPQGRLQIRMTGIDPVYTLGALVAERERTLAALASEGLLDRNSRLDLPAVPLRLGLVTAKGSAAFADFIHELDSSGFSFHVALAPAAVQGRAAGRSVVAALNHLGDLDLDAIALVRGGGDRGDLATFDNEVIARSIASCPVPVLVGIGHELDSTVADRVAHTSLKTPTACAAVFVHRVAEFVAALDRSWTAITGAALSATDRPAQQLTGRAHALRSGVRHHLRSRAAGIDAPTSRLAPRAHRALDRAEHRMAEHELRRRALDPNRLLERGWSLTLTSERRTIRSVGEVEPGSGLVTVLADGEVRSTVTSVGGGSPDEGSR